MKTKFIVTIITLLTVSLNWVGAANLKATVNRSKVAVGQTFQITFTLSNASGGNFEPPSFEEFNVLGGPNQSTNMQIINGNMSQSISYSYHLSPKQVGNFDIGPAYMKVGKQRLQSNVVTVQVVKGNAGSANNQNNGGNKQSNDLNAQVRESVFVKLTVDKTKAFQGEQITATYKLYKRANISNTSLSKAPSYTGFWVHEFDMPKHLQFKNESYNNMQFQVAELKKVALFAQRSGELEIDPMELETYVRVQTQQQRNNFWGSFFGNYQDLPYSLKSNSVKVQVVSLPAAGKPASFEGAVGEFALKVELDKTSTEVDNPITLKMRVSGKGNMKMINAPELNLPQDFEVYDPKTSESSNKNRNVVQGSKQFDFLIIPRRPGEFKVQGFTFPYFDIKKEEYVVLSSPEYVIRVGGEVSQYQPMITGIDKADVELIGEDIRFIKLEIGSLSKKPEGFYASAPFAGFLSTPILLFAVLLFYRKREEQISGNAALVKLRRATKLANKRLAAAKKHMKNEERKEFYDETARAIWGYLSDKLNLGGAELIRDEVHQHLSQKGVTEPTVEKFKSVLDNCEMALFAPSSDGDDMQKTYDSAAELFGLLESEIS